MSIQVGQARSRGILIFNMLCALIGYTIFATGLQNVCADGQSLSKTQTTRLAALLDRLRIVFPVAHSVT